MGAELVTRGRAHEIKDFFETVAALLGAYGIEPMDRMSGLRPHITLGYDRLLFDAFNVIRHWVPEELLLIESPPRPDGKRREHIILHRWPLLPPAQSAFAFMAEDPPAPRMPPLRCAA